MQLVLIEGKVEERPGGSGSDPDPQTEREFEMKIGMGKAEKRHNEKVKLEEQARKARGELERKQAELAEIAAAEEAERLAKVKAEVPRLKAEVFEASDEVLRAEQAAFRGLWRALDLIVAQEKAMIAFYGARDRFYKSSVQVGAYEEIQDPALQERRPNPGCDWHQAVQHVEHVMKRMLSGFVKR